MQKCKSLTIFIKVYIHIVDIFTCIKHILRYIYISLLLLISILLLLYIYNN